MKKKKQFPVKIPAELRANVNRPFEYISVLIMKINLRIYWNIHFEQILNNWDWTKREKNKLFCAMANEMCGICNERGNASFLFSIFEKKNTNLFINELNKLNRFKWRYQ